LTHLVPPTSGRSFKRKLSGRIAALVIILSVLALSRCSLFGESTPAPTPTVAATALPEELPATPPASAPCAPGSWRCAVCRSTSVFRPSAGAAADTADGGLGSSAPPRKYLGFRPPLHPAGASSDPRQLTWRSTRPLELDRRGGRPQICGSRSLHPLRRSTVAGRKVGDRPVVARVVGEGPKRCGGDTSQTFAIVWRGSPSSSSRRLRRLTDGGGS